MVRPFVAGTVGVSVGLDSTVAFAEGVIVGTPVVVITGIGVD